MKYVLKHFLLAVVILVSSCQDGGEKINANTHTFYKTYTISIPANNYIIISSRGFGPDNYLVLDLNDKSLRIYSPYESKGLLLNRELKKAEINEILETFESKEYMELPERNNKVALDAEEINIKSTINNREKRIYHILPDDKTIRHIINLYSRLNNVAK